MGTNGSGSRRSPLTQWVLAQHPCPRGVSSGNPDNLPPSPSLPLRRTQGDAAQGQRDVVQEESPADLHSDQPHPTLTATLRMGLCDNLLPGPNAAASGGLSGLEFLFTFTADASLADHSHCLITGH